MTWLTLLSSAMFVVRWCSQVSSRSTGIDCPVRTTTGDCCVFPFTYRGKVYEYCTTVDNENVPWCSLTSNYKWGKWGNCHAQDVDWPRGSYGFPKPKSGCPGDKNNWWWHEGWRFQDMEDDSKNISRRSRTSPGSHMSVTINIDRDVNRTFCMKQNPGTKDWPKGEYCIYKSTSGACPANMDSGWVKWDDENQRNHNKRVGWLPDGRYDEDTRIEYCCQTKGHWDASIELPLSQPFYLLTSSATDSPKCQMVKWALSYLEYIVFDTEDSANGDDESGDHVFLEGTKIYYCYYEDCRSTLSGPGGSFRSYQAAESDMDPRSQYCSWLITIAKSYFVSLSFKELTIPSCDDTFLKIFDGSNDTAPLLGTYCSTNASTKIEILSSTNNLFIVSNSGSYARNPKSVFSFHAEYDAAMHLTGCHYEVLESSGYITSPKFYPRPSNCSWLVSVNDAHLVTLNVSYLKIGDDDVIEVYDGPDENTSILAFYSRYNNSENNGTLLSSSNKIFIILKYGISSSYQTGFAFEYGSQPRPTEKLTTLQMMSTVLTAKTQEPNREKADQGEGSQTTNIVVAVVVGVVVVLILIAIFIFIKSRRNKANTSSIIDELNPSNSLRKKVSERDNIDLSRYAASSSPQEKVWVENSKTCKESDNLIYEPADEQQPAALFASADHYEQLDENKRVGGGGGGAAAAESDNLLYDVGDVASTHVYAEPITSPEQSVVYDKPEP